MSFILFKNFLLSRLKILPARFFFKPSKKNRALSEINVSLIKPAGRGRILTMLLSL